MFKGLSTKSGNLIKIKIKITGICSQTTLISCLTNQSVKKSNVPKIFRFKVEV